MGTVTFRGEGGGIHRMRLPLPPGIADRLASGSLHRIDPAPAADVPTPEVETLAGRYTEAEKATAADDVQLRDAPEKPNPRGRKADWVDWVVHHFPDEITRSAADDLTRDELVARFGDRHEEGSR